MGRLLLKQAGLFSIAFSFLYDLKALPYQTTVVSPSRNASKCNFSERMFTGCYRDCVVISDVVIYDSRDFMSCNHMTMCFLCLQVCRVVSISQNREATLATPECNVSFY